MSALERPDDAGNTAAVRVAELYGRHGRMVAGLCRGMLRDPEEAADAAQQTFLAAQKALRAGTHPDEPAAALADCRVLALREQNACGIKVVNCRSDG